MEDNSSVGSVLDIFSGAGGLSCGLSMAGWSIAGGVDSSERATETFSLNHDCEALTHDLTTATADSILDELGISDVDLVVGGPPCTDFSKANTKIDLGRNNLVLVFAKHVESIRPRAFVIENVRQLLSADDGEIVDGIHDILGREYQIAYRLLDSADYGVPQHRVRAFVIGIRRDVCDEKIGFPKPTYGPDSDGGEPIVTAGDALGPDLEPDDSDEYSVNSEHSHLLDDVPPGMDYRFHTSRYGHPNPSFEWRSRFSDYLYKASPDKPVRTLKAQPGAASGPFHWDNRRFTEAELKRLHGFPDWFEFPHGYTEVVRQIGNAVPPLQAREIGRVVADQIRFGFSERVMIDSATDLDFYSRKRTTTEEYESVAEERLIEMGYSPEELGV